MRPLGPVRIIFPSKMAATPDTVRLRRPPFVNMMPAAYQIALPLGMFFSKIASNGRHRERQRLEQYRIHHR